MPCDKDKSGNAMFSLSEMVILKICISGVFKNLD